MLERANKRWDNAYTVYSNDLTEEEQKYRDYFETDLQNYREDERLEEVTPTPNLVLGQAGAADRCSLQPQQVRLPGDLHRQP